MDGQLPAPKKTCYGSQYHNRELEFYFETAKQHLSTVSNAIHDLDRARIAVETQQAAVEADIQWEIEQLHKALEERKAELIGHLDQITQQKLKTVCNQRDELEQMKTQLNNCLQRSAVQEIKKICTDFDVNKFTPQEQGDLTFITGCELLPACQQFGQVLIHPICPEKCYATGEGLETATVGEQSTVTVHAIDRAGKQCTDPLPDTSISFELVSCITSERVNCTVNGKTNKYNIVYQPTLRGRHQLHIKISDQHIRGSPFTVIAKQEIFDPIRTIPGLRGPGGVAINERGEIIIAEYSGNCISIYNPNGEKVKSFGRKGTASGEFNTPRGVAVDRAGNILVVDESNHRIQQFTGVGEFMGLVGCRDGEPSQFDRPVGICISSSNKKYICDSGNHRVQILDPDLIHSFGRQGSCDGQFKTPSDVALDSHGNVYVADSGNHRIQVFTEDGRFLRKFGKKGAGDGELNWPAGVAIDSDNVVYVAERDNHRISFFTSEGHFLESFGKKGRGPGQFDEPLGIAVDRNGVVYVSDWNTRLQIF